MIREIVKPKDNTLIIKIPQEYIGKEIEYIVFPLKNNKSIEKKDLSSDISILGGSLHKYAKKNKIKLEDKAWELHIIDKFSK